MSASRKRILFVDDEVPFLNSLRRMLRDQRHAWDMTFLSDPSEALRVAQETAFDAFVLDVRMKGMDGLELLAGLRQRENSREVPVILLTGEAADDELKTLALNLGASDVLFKPVRQDELLSRVRSMLRLKAYQDQLKELNRTLETRVLERTCELAHSRIDILWRLAKAGEYRDEETGEHVLRVGCYARTLAVELGLPREFTERLFLTAPLHDIGKIGIPDRILLKTGELTLDERAAMQRHCRIGADILSRRPRGLDPFLRQAGMSPETGADPDNQFLDMAAAIALGHHERWDGEGYPQGLVGEDTALAARIVTVADVYDALSSSRPYKPAFPEDRVRTTLLAQSGRQFDPSIIHAFKHRADEFAAIRNELANRTCFVSEKP